MSLESLALKTVRISAQIICNLFFPGASTWSHNLLYKLRDKYNSLRPNSLISVTGACNAVQEICMKKFTVFKEYTK